MTSKDVIQAGENWHEIVVELQSQLAGIRSRLIEAEAELAERLAAINAFEFRVRARLGPLTRRLDDLQAEIDEIRAMIRRYQADAFEDLAFTEEDKRAYWRFDQHDGAAASSSFRYRRRPETAPVTLKAEQIATLKQLYRQLARRFHPDLALSEAERAYRTDIMMAINSAYTAGDIEKLRQLALEPSPEPGSTQTDQALAIALQQELQRCNHRLDEIAQELAALESHDSARLLKRAERAAAQGRDLLDEIASDLRSRIAEKLVERDVLEEQLDEAEREGVEMSAEDLADIVFNLGLEQAGEESLFEPSRDWQPKNRNRWEQKGLEDEENPLDDLA